MTSNVGAKHLRKGTAIGFSKGGADAEQERVEAAIAEEIKKIFNPEFINRIDELITFRALGEESLIDIVEILLAGLEKRMQERDIKLEISQAAKQKIVKEGTDTLMGARPLKRALQRLIEDALAENFLEGRFSDGSIIQIDLENDELTFNPKDSLQSKEV
jgi:ATP-dependent Clp protease ATP-binding subunit ClpC